MIIHFQEEKLNEGTSLVALGEMKKGTPLRTVIERCEAGQKTKINPLKTRIQPVSRLLNLKNNLLKTRI